MKYLISCLLSLAVMFNLNAQVDCFFEGPNYIECAPTQETFWFGCNGQFNLPFDFRIYPEDFGAEVIGFDTLSVQVDFFYGVQYTLWGYVETPTGIDSFGIDIIVEEPIDPVITSCFERDSSCFQVCESSPTIISNIDPNIQIEVEGASDVSYTSNGVEITWDGPGFGSINLFNFCGITYSYCFEIFPEPEVDFEPDVPINNDTMTVCKEQEVFFTNNSINATKYIWNFGDGENEEAFEVSHTWLQEGFYTLTLSGSSVCECADEKSIVVEVLDAPAPILECLNSVCPNTRQRYTANTDGCSNFQWAVSSNGTIIDGGESDDDYIEVIWEDGPDGFIDLSVSSCNIAYCSFTNRFRVPIITTDGPIEGDASVCSGEMTIYRAPYFPGAVYNWSISGNGVIVGDRTSNGISVHWDN
ncbi:MAG: PKD domain-containing protein, partial [Bacteroidota bacterium]